VGKLQAVRGKNIWMMGGAGIIASFLDAGAIDEFSIHVIPVMIGEGIPLVAPRHRNIPLQLISTRSFPDGGCSLELQRSTLTGLDPPLRINTTWPIRA